MTKKIILADYTYREAIEKAKSLKRETQSLRDDLRELGAKESTQRALAEAHMLVSKNLRELLKDARQVIWESYGTVSVSFMNRIDAALGEGK